MERRGLAHRMRRVLHRLPWIGRGAAIAASICFVAGCVAFLAPDGFTLGVVLFLIGSLAMLVGSVADALTRR